MTSVASVGSLECGHVPLLPSEGTAVKGSEPFESWLKGPCSYVGRCGTSCGSWWGGWLKKELQEEDKRGLKRHKDVMYARESSPPLPTKEGAKEGVSSLPPLNCSPDS